MMPCLRIARIRRAPNVRGRPALAGVSLLAAGMLATPVTGQEGGVRLPFDACGVLTGDPRLDVRGAQEIAYKLLEASGAATPESITLRRASGRPNPCAASSAGRDAGDGGEVRLGPVRLRAAGAGLTTALNTRYPSESQNGLMWEGRGVSAMLHAGIVAEAGPVQAGWIPEIAYQQNASFDIRPARGAGISEFGNPFYTTIDQPQRFGPDAYWTLDLAGQSFLRIQGFGLAAGVSHENLVAGPAHRNPIIMSAGAPGFAHLFIETARPLDLWIARVDFRIVMGRLEESPYFDGIPDNDRNAIALWTLGLRPRALDGLELGVARSYMYRPERPGSLVDFGALSGFLGFTTPRNLPGNEMASLYGRWVLPGAGAEIYGEWSRDDRFANLQDLIMEPDLTQGYTVGFQKLTELGSGVLRIAAELTALQEEQEPRAGRPNLVYYTHHGMIQGYTHQGQILGAPIGPGADAQYVGVDWLEEWGYVGTFLERVRRNNWSSVAITERWTYPFDHDTELTGGVRAMLPWKGMTLSGTIAYGHRWNRDFLADEGGLKLRLEFRGRPDRLF